MSEPRPQSTAACRFADQPAPARRCFIVRSTWIAFFALYLIPAAAFAQRVEITSPLQGNFRTGRCFAVQINGESLHGEQLSLTGTGVLPVLLPITAGRVDATVPLIAQGEPPAELNWSDGATSGVVPMASHSLGADERLIVLAGDASDTASLLSTLFPGQRPVLVHLDLTRTRLLQPTMAFESVDAVLLDTNAAARIDESELRSLLACGTTVAIQSNQKPLADWPWRQLQQWWVLQHEVGGPRSGAEPEIYRPTAAWDTSWPATMRVTILLAAVAAAIVIIALTLLRPRVLAFGISIAGCIALAITAWIYGSRLPTTAVAGGEVLLRQAGLSQHDRYTYIAAKQATTTLVDATIGITKPVLWQRRPIEGLSFRLFCSSDGSPLRYEVTLPAKHRIAFLSRTVTPDSPTGDLEKVTAPIGLFADQLYPGQMIGQNMSPPADAPAGQWWGTVVMRK